jgi:tryptophan synthase alpha chain
MSRIQQLFANRKAFIAYLTAGDGGMQRTLDAAVALIEGGVNMLEIGIPFSDPIADGPIIQRAAARSLAGGTTLQDVLWLTEQIRQRSDVPLILFSYFNPILSALQSDFLHAAKCVGIDGLLLVDCPFEESQLVQQQCAQNDVALIYVITSTTSLTRIHKINRYAQGFLYYACRKGTTGIRNRLPDDFQQKIQSIKSIVDLPVIVGFGISNQEMANRVLEHADGVVVGSLFVKMLEEGVHPSILSALARDIYPSSQCTN